MRCPQCGEFLLSAAQSHEIASAYCEDCEQVWEWSRSAQRQQLSGRSGCWAARWTLRRSAPASAAGRQAGYGPVMSQEAAWRGRLLRQTEAAEAPVLPAGR
jgi:hypothetical protein